MVATLLAFVDRAQVLYGSDWPFTPGPNVAVGADWITDNEHVTPVELSAAARRLFPRLA